MIDAATRRSTHSASLQSRATNHSIALPNIGQRTIAMHKRQFVASMVAAAAWPVAAQAKTAPIPPGPVVLTVTGAIAKSNRAPFDPAFDVLMSKHGVKFAAAYALEWARLAALPTRTIEPTLEYDGKPHRLRGPLLTDVLRAAGVRASGSSTLALRAVDGYAPTMTWADAQSYAFIVATHRDDQPLALGGLGPLWAVYDADRFPEAAAKPLSARFANCPWGLYHIDVRAS
jgi:hypothetical protein